MLIGGEGRITAVGPSGTVTTPEGAESLQLPDAILLPGLVNTHTHLELTGSAHTASELDFRRWILSIRRRKQELGHPEFLAAARLGLRECWAGGVTTIADTGDSGATLEVLSEEGGSGIVYHEVFGPDPAQLEESFAELERRVAELTRFSRDRVRLGVSPHAPYSVSGPLYARVAAWARSRTLPLAVHLAESPAESELVCRNAGPFAEAWRARGIPLLDDQRQQPTGPPSDRATAHPLASPVSWLDHLAVLGPDALCIHAIQLSAADIRLLAERGVAVAHCPVSNAAHGHGAAPLAALRRAGIRVGLGTDSAASVGQLDLFREAREAQALARLDDAEALALVTLEGARALGLQQEIGSLTPGKWGDLAAVRVRSGREIDDPRRRALQSGPADVALTVLGGRVVHRAAPA